MKHTIFAVVALLIGMECKAADLLSGLVSVDIPESYKKFTEDKNEAPGLGQTEIVTFVSGKGTSFSAQVMSGNKEIGDLEAAGLTLDDLANSGCHKRSEYVKKNVIISGVDTKYESCVFMAGSSMVKTITMSAFFAGKFIQFSILGKTSEDKEVEELLQAVQGAKLNKR